MGQPHDAKSLLAAGAARCDLSIVSAAAAKRPAGEAVTGEDGKGSAWFAGHGRERRGERRSAARKTAGACARDGATNLGFDGVEGETQVGGGKA